MIEDPPPSGSAAVQSRADDAECARRNEGGARVVEGLGGGPRPGAACDVAAWRADAALLMAPSLPEAIADPTDETPWH
jgi:hypothetical protein